MRKNVAQDFHRTHTTLCRETNTLTLYFFKRNRSGVVTVVGFKHCYWYLKKKNERKLDICKIDSVPNCNSSTAVFIPVACMSIWPSWEFWLIAMSKCDNLERHHTNSLSVARWVWCVVWASSSKPQQGKNFQYKIELELLVPSFIGFNLNEVVVGKFSFNNL